MNERSSANTIILVLMITLFITSLIVVVTMEPVETAILAILVLICLLLLSMTAYYFEEIYQRLWLKMITMTIILFSIAFALIGVYFQHLWALITLSIPWVGMRVASYFAEKRGVQTLPKRG